MAKNKTVPQLNSMIDKFLSTVKTQVAGTSAPYIPDIITFCEDPKYLNICGGPNPIQLFPLQKIALKTFYRGTAGNEKITLTPSEIKRLESLEMKYVIDKFNSGQLFRELVLVWGRRCVGENTLVFDPTTGESTKIGELWDSGKRVTNVCSLDESTYSFVKSSAEIIYNGVQPTFELTLLDGRKIEATDNHPFLTIDGWKQLSELKEKDRIAVPGVLPFFGTSDLAEEEVSLIGYMPIKKIEKSKNQRTFDLSVQDENRHNFVANGIICHNSGKDMLASFIAAYEAMRLLEIPGGNPFSYYKIKEGNPICILTVAGSDEQAKVLFNEIKTVIINSPYFQDKIGDNGKAIDSSKIVLLTPADKLENEKRAATGVAPTSGNVMIIAGHSNSDTLRGKRTFLLLLDEVAMYASTGGASGGETIFNALVPSTNDFKITYKEKGHNKTRLDSKIVFISSPRGKEGIFYRMWHQSFDQTLGKQRVMMKAPTWEVNLKDTREDVRRDYASMSEQEFAMEFGAEFSGLQGEKFISDEYVDRAIDQNLGQKEVGMKGVLYYCHVDPAATSHNYALVVIHFEPYIKHVPIPGTEKTKKEYRKRYVVDHMRVWTPTGERGIDFEEVDNYVINLSKRFRFAMVSYDAFEARASMQKLRKNGIPSKITGFRMRYKVEIYKNLENLLIAGDIVLPANGQFAKLLELELKNLKRIWVPNGGFRIKPNDEAEVKTDDLTDALSGACGVAVNMTDTGYVKPELSYTPVSRDSSPVWRIGGGTFTNSQFSEFNKKFGFGG